ncbi:MAG: 16S rRNA (guanine(966)-N(2))-methyltransferase RsmD [Gemmatimonadetes bacterium]|nr:16S rRNA (guanine(966)-N(2))-methyltransferase RsmD [Gemmatimonadota bacterium]NNK48167.1 16S rRNA (guanine(966)-N(2))-methyltransferase RsmD [Gemmatimonadota bacterium]
MSLRIIAGEFRGRRIQSPEGRSTRPTRQEVREAWFNVLGDRVVGSRVLDLFAGSGALGLEALSRGASEVCFVESSRTVLSVLRRNIEALGAAARCEVLGMDALALISNLERDGGRVWDVVLADPPYASGAAARLASTFARSPFAGILCVEHGLDVDFTVEPDWQRRYGETVLSIFLDPIEGAANG